MEVFLELENLRKQKVGIEKFDIMIMGCFLNGIVKFQLTVIPYGLHR